MLIGVVGKPSAGKSTFFKAATMAEVDIANYPFTTIKPNHAVGYVKVKDPALDFGKHSNPKQGFVQGDFRFVPVELLDVAGLVPGAHKGEGMGSQFLNDLNQADVLIHVVDISGSVDAHGKAVDPLSYDPLNDIEFLEQELDHWYLAIMKNGWQKFARLTQHAGKEPYQAIAQHMSGLRVGEDMVKEGLKQIGLEEKPIVQWSEEDILGLARQLRIKSKPMIIAANKIDIPGAEENMKKMQKAFPYYTVVACSAEAELALKQAHKQELIEYIPGATFEFTGTVNEKQREALEMMKEKIIARFGSTGVQEVLDKAVFSLLEYISVFPGGSKLEDKEGRTLPDCFLMPKGSTALQFAYRLHTDFGENFIKAIDIRTKRAVGKEHPLKSGDIIEIVTKK